MTHGVYLNMAVHVLRFDSHEQRPEPFKRTKVSAHPKEVNFTQPRLLLRVVHPVPDAFEDGSKGRHPNACTYQYCYFVLEHVFRCTAEGSVHVDAGEYLTYGRIHARTSCLFIHTNDRRALGSFLFPSPLELTSECFAKSFREVTDTPDMH